MKKVRQTFDVAGFVLISQRPVAVAFGPPPGRRPTIIRRCERMVGDPLIVFRFLAAGYKPDFRLTTELQLFSGRNFLDPAEGFEEFSVTLRLVAAAFAALQLNDREPTERLALDFGQIKNGYTDARR